MARLITTKAERDAASYLDWDDAALGRFCKQMALKLSAKRKEHLAEGVKNDDFRAVINASDGILIVGSMVAQNVGALTYRFGDFTHKDEPAGDWEIRVRQLRKPEKAG